MEKEDIKLYQLRVKIDSELVKLFKIAAIKQEITEREAIEQALSAWLGHSMQSIAKAKRVPKGWDMV
jgi:hypothetical protein